MDGSARRRRSAWQVLAGLLFCGTFCAEDAARAQTSASGKSQSQERSQARNGEATGQSGTDRAGAGAPGGRVQGPGRAQTQPQNEPSAAYRESLRRTVEKRRQRRARRGQQQEQGTAPGAIGAIVPWPMPPALIIRQTPDAHGEVGAFIGGLRRREIASHRALGLFSPLGPETIQTVPPSELNTARSPIAEPDRCNRS